MGLNNDLYKCRKFVEMEYVLLYGDGNYMVGLGFGEWEYIGYRLFSLIVN